MKKFLIIFTILIYNYQNVSSQESFTDISSYKVMYNLEYQKDSTDINSKQNEKMILLIGKKYSLFQSLNNKYNDSLKNALAINNSDASIAITKALAQKKSSRFSFRILKSNEDIIVFDSYFSDKFIYKDEEQQIWEITKITDTISGYYCTLAISSFAGREYKAWFTSEIPINDGPYKFRGLPGLIVKIEDTRQHYKFELEMFQKKEEAFKFDTSIGIEVSKREFFESYNVFKKNFISQLSQRGIDLDNNTSRETQKRVQKSRNNEIEIRY